MTSDMTRELADKLLSGEVPNTNGTTPGQTPTKTNNATKNSEKAKKDSDSKKYEPGPVKLLHRYIATAYKLVHYQGKPYVVSRGTRSFDGTPGVAQPFGTFRRRLAKIGQTAKGVGMISKATADTVMFHLESDAFAGPETPLSLRFHSEPGRVCVDMGRDDGRTIVITRKGWEVATKAPEGVIFRRSHAIKPLPHPQPGASYAELADLLALDPDGDVFKMLVGWQVGLPFVASVRPGLLLTGPPGTGKSTRARLLVSVVEPTGTDGLGSAFGRNFADDHVRALHRAAPIWDNLTSVSGATSDALCTLVTGTARETRTLYSDNELNTAPVARPVALTAVATPAGLRADALDRLIIAELDAPPARTDDAALQAAFDDAHPRLLGAWCDAISAVLRGWDSTDPPTQYRMASHARVLSCLDAATTAGELPGLPRGVLDAYATAQQEVKQATATDDVFGAALLNMLATRPTPKPGEPTWKGTATELLTATRPHGWANVNSPGWPSTARGVPDVLGQLSGPLAACGVVWQPGTEKPGRRIYKFFTLSDQEGVG